MYTLVSTNRFKKDIQMYQRDVKTSNRLKDIFHYFIQGLPLPMQYKDHALKGKFLGYRECHVFPDTLLIYEKDDKEKIITLAYIGTHSDLFK